MKWWIKIVFLFWRMMMKIFLRFFNLDFLHVAKVNLVQKCFKSCMLAFIHYYLNFANVAWVSRSKKKNLNY